jgi:SpoVK/Ycf46/Vps4 family AAA+-type ATPase
VDYYATSLEHLLAELSRVDLHIRAQVWRARALHADRQDELAALYVDESEVERRLTQALGLPAWADVPLPDAVERDLQAVLEQSAAALAQRVAESLRRGIDLRLVRLAQTFGLSAFDTDAIVIALAPQLDRRYERFYGYLHDDLTQKHPTVDLVLNLLCPQLDTRIAARSRFARSAPLCRFELLRLLDDFGARALPLVAKSLLLDPRIADYLLGEDHVDARLDGYVSCRDPQALQALPAATAEQLSRLSSWMANSPEEGHAPIVYFHNRQGGGQEVLAQAWCAQQGCRLLAVSTRRLRDLKVDEFATLVNLVNRESLLQGAVVYWDEITWLLDDAQQTRRELFVTALAEHPGVTLLSGNAVWEPAHWQRGRGFLRMEVPLPDYAQRVQHWKMALPDAELGLEAVAAKFRFSDEQIDNAAVIARAVAQRRDPASGRVCDADVYAACRLQSSRKLAALAQPITPHYAWNDIVLPPEQLEQLRAICHHVAHRDLVYDVWGFDKKLAMGKGLNALFAGPPGTGKTMAADIMAHELGLDLYKIDLSTVVSKYIGETEKNLSSIFADARSSNAILFFDEADALFGKRSEVRDAHDRYANIETSYLLQKMEEYDGIVILASNYRKNMDDAFVRRLHFIVEFPFPKAEERRRIWQGIWPDNAPRGADLDLDALAERIEVAGGNIRNIVLASAFLAAAEDDVVQMKHLLQATQREYRKMGKVLVAEDLAGVVIGAARPVP